ncbi:MAG: hypothetical protein JWP74_1464 [Marmoricola sp.]|nr:hypothetical protein [Marmoricola sp.]
MSVRRGALTAAVTLLTVAAVAGCGGSSKPAAVAPHSSAPSPAAPTAALDPPEPTNTTLEVPKAKATISPSATLSAVPGASDLPVPHGSPRTIEGFPVPPGVHVKDPGPIDDTWQFDIPTKTPDEVIAFYKRVLPQMGFTVRTDVTYTIGYEKVRWDLAFDGPVSGTMVRDKRDGTVFVVVNPPGQKALPGDQ